jgi:hypothetical protein
MVTNTAHAIFCYVFKEKIVDKITVAFDIQHTAKTGAKNISSAETLFPLLIIESLLEFVLFTRNFSDCYRALLVSSNPSFVLSYTDM